MPVTPFFSPFYSPFSPVISIGGGPVSFLFNMLAFAAIASVLFNLFSRTGGSSFSTDGEERGSLGAGATVLKLQLALDADWAQRGHIMETLAAIASSSSSSNRAELSRLLSEASLALLRRQDDWQAASLSGQRFSQPPLLSLPGSRAKEASSEAEPYFQRLAVQERSKFARESLSGVRRLRGGGAARAQTQAVVSLLVALRGQSDALRKVQGSGDVRAVLQTLASEALSDEGDNVLAVEVLWTPSEDGDVLSQRQLVLDYPELLQL
jgi:uncharacterized membrane protein